MAKVWLYEETSPGSDKYVCIKISPAILKNTDVVSVDKVQIGRDDVLDALEICKDTYSHAHGDRGPREEEGRSGCYEEEDLELGGTQCVLR